MKRLWSLPVAVLLPATAALGGSWSAQRLKPMCLAAHDLPPGFVQVGSRPYDNALFAHDAGGGTNVKFYSQTLHRVTGYETWYRRNGPGLYWVSDNVSAFRSSQAANLVVALAARSVLKITFNGSRFRPVYSVHISAWSEAFVAQARLRGGTYQAVWILFSQGPLAGMLSANGSGVAPILGEVVRLADIMESRMKTATGGRSAN